MRPILPFLLLFAAFAPAGTLAPRPEAPAGLAPAAERIDLAALRRAAGAGDVAAQTKLGIAYAYGWTGVPDGSEALTWLDRASAASAEAAREAGLLLLRGDATLEADPPRAARYLARGADGGDARAAGTLGWMRLTGDGVPQDWAGAKALTRRAADAGDREAMLLMGKFSALGSGGEAPDVFAATAWFALADIAGATDAPVWLAILAEPNDPVFAREVFESAAETGSTLAMVRLAAALRVGSGGPADAPLAMRWLSLAAEDGSADAEFELYEAYDSGTGVAQDRIVAFGWLKRAADHGHTEALAILADDYAWGFAGPGKNPALAARTAEAALVSERRNALFAPAPPGGPLKGRLTRARFDLGAALLALHPDGVAVDRAVGLFKEGVAERDALSINQMGLMTHAGWGVPKDPAAAADLYRQAAELGSDWAMLNYANALAAGDGVARDDARALDWYRRAAAADRTEAFLPLAEALAAGRGGAADPSGAVTWFGLAANRGLTRAMLRLGEIAQSGAYGQPRDIPVAMRWYGAALRHTGRDAGEAAYQMGQIAEQGLDGAANPGRARAWYFWGARWHSRAATRRVSDAYRLGELGLPMRRDLALALLERVPEAERDGQVLALMGELLEETDPARARGLLFRAAAAGVPFAQNTIGVSFEHGALGLPRDPALAVAYYRMAALAGDATGQSNLAIALWQGRGTAEDRPGAFRWATLAAGQGSAAAERTLGWLYWQGGPGLPADHAAAVPHFERAAGLGDNDAAYMLSVAYRTGDGTAQDWPAHFRWVRQAAEAGNPDAQNSLGYGILAGFDDTFDFVEATKWLILATERYAPGAEERQRALVNLRNAQAQLRPGEADEAERRAEAWRRAHPR